MCYYLNVQFQGQRVKPLFMPVHTVKPLFMSVHTVKPLFMSVHTVKPLFMPVHTVKPLFMSVHTVKISTMCPGLANRYVGACPNCLNISNKFFRVNMEILKSKIRYWRLR